MAPPTPSPAVSDSGAEVRQLLNAAERDLAEQRLTSPQAGNAVEKYRRVLVLDLANENAKRGLGRVVEKYREMFETKLETGDLKGARKPLNQAADVLPESTVVNEMRERLKLAEAELAKRSEKTPVVSAPASARALNRDCTGCPEMVEVPAGAFDMGSSDDEPNRELDGTYGSLTVHRVTIQRFALGRYEVTFAEYDAFALATGRALPNDQGWGRDKRPVINVSWEDAQAYAQWLSERTGKRYRLPSEAEWEYAARAKTTTARFWGDNPADACQYANVHDKSHKCIDTYEYTAPVGRFKSNSFGAYDILGNVWEWVQDCSHDDYQGAPRDGTAWEENGCALRVFRGGSWGYLPWLVRSVDRARISPDTRGYTLGFRLAQDI